MPFTSAPQNFNQAEVDTLKNLVQGVINHIILMNNTNTALTREERREGVTVAENRKAYTDYYFGNKNNFPLLKPSVAETLVPEVDADKHYFIHSKLDESLLLLRQAAEKVSDMQLNSEHFCFNFANEGRNTALKAKKLGKPDADTWADALDELYPDLGPNDNQNP